MRIAVEFFTRQRGFTLVEVMVAVAILAFAGVGVSVLFRSVGTQQRNLDRFAQAEIIRHTLRTQASCRSMLGIRSTAQLPASEECEKFRNKTLPIVGRDGFEIFQMHRSGDFYRVNEWQIRARCENETVIFEGRLNAPGRVKAKADALFGEWRDLFNGTSRFCGEYLSNNAMSCTNPAYQQRMSFDSGGVLCCRAVRVQGVGEAVARCAPHEVLVQGGGQCAGILSKPREIPKARMTGAAIGDTKATKTTTAPPGVPHFFFPTADMVGNIMAPTEKGSVKRGGFLVKNVPAENEQRVLDRWESLCRADDSIDDFPVVVDAVCCPRRW